MKRQCVYDPRAAGAIPYSFLFARPRSQGGRYIQFMATTRDGSQIHSHAWHPKSYVKVMIEEAEAREIRVKR